MEGVSEDEEGESEAFCRRLVLRFPQIRPLLEAHLRADTDDPEDQYLYAHIFFAQQFGSWFNSLIEGGSESDLRLARSIASHLEEVRACATDEGLLALLRVTFVEIFGYSVDVQKRVARILGPTLLEDYREFLRILGVPVTI